MSPLIPAWRKALYALLTVALVLALAETALWLAGIRPLSGTEDPYMGFARRMPLFVPERQADGSTRMVTATNKLGLFNRQSFAADKPDGTYRVFCLGGSTTYGHPYEDSMSFCGWLRRFLAAADPSRRWEVVNAGGISYASYRVTALMEELAAYRPDLFIVYSGHNEFIEERTYRDIRRMPKLLVEADAALGRSRLFSAIRRAARPEPVTMGAEVEEKLARTIGPTSYRRDDSLRANVTEHYRFNLGRMVALARAAGSDILFVTPAANLKDMSPFKSEHRADLAGDELARWERDFAEAKAMPDPAARLAVLDRLLARDDRHAEALYERGRALLALDRVEAAQVSLARALEEDVVPLRAFPSMVEDVRQVAREHGVPLVDFVAMVEAWTMRDLGHPIPGKEWFVDHVHLSVEGYRLLALELLETLRAKGVVTPQPGWNAETVERISREAVAGLDKADHGNALVTVATVLGWAGQFEEAHRLLLDARPLLGDDLALLLKLGHSAERRRQPDEAAGFYREAAAAHPQAAAPRRRLAELAASGRDIQAELALRAELVELSPDSVSDRARLADLLAAREEWPEAARHYRELVRQRPGDALAQYNLGLALDTLGDMNGALAAFEASRRLDPRQPEPHLGVAGVLERRGDMAGAQAAYAEAARQAPESALARLGYGVALARAGRIDQAIEHLQKAVELEPRSPKAHFNLGQALRQAGRLGEAESHLREARRLGVR